MINLNLSRQYRRRIAVSNAQGMFVAASTSTPELSVPTPTIKIINILFVQLSRSSYLAFEQEILF